MAADKIFAAAHRFVKLCVVTCKRHALLRPDKLELETRPLGEIFSLLAKHDVVDEEAVLAALVFLSRLTISGKVEITAGNVDGLFLVAVMVAHKFSNDTPYDNVTFAQIGDVDIEDLNTVELELLKWLSWKLFYTKEDLRTTIDLLREIVAVQTTAVVGSAGSSSCEEASPLTAASPIARAAMAS